MSLALRHSAAVLAAALSVGCPPREPSARACFAAVNQGFETVRAAAQRSLEVCLRGAGSDCVDADPLGVVRRARAAALASEARACRAGELPEFGFAGAEVAVEAAIGSVRALARGLFGPDLDAARAPRAQGRRSALCQERLLEAAGRCAARFVREYQSCAVGALADADDPFDLSACKGKDFGGRIARACEGGIASVARHDCEGLEVAELFPGCAGDVEACARGHARRSVSLALNDANALCQDVLPGSLPEAQLLACFEPPPAEPIVWHEVPMPTGTNPLTVEWDEGGERLLVGFSTEGVAGTQLGSVVPSGDGFRCLTCGAGHAADLRPVQRLRDGRRVLLAGPNNPRPRWQILECTPSLLQCESATLLPIELPANPDRSAPILQYRVPWVTLDDAWLVWTEVRLRGPGGNVSAMGRLVRDASRYVLTDARVIAPPLRSLAIGTDPVAWRQLTQPVEAKFGALRGGRDWVEAGTPGAGHYDASVIDLATGGLRRLTHYPDHDEGLRFSRDEQWAVLQSARTDGRTEFLGLLPRPPYIDWIAFSVHFVGIAGAPGDGASPGGDPNERDCFVDPWLLDRWFERGAYIGQRLLRPADGWVSIEGNAGGFGWAPDGTKLALIERRWRHSEPEGQTRLRIASLPNRTPIAAADVVPIVPTPEPTWAIRYEDWIVPDTLGVTVIPGQVSGTATIRNAMPSPAHGEVEVVYDAYSDGGAEILDGFERLRIPTLLLAGAEYEVDLSLGGARTGSMRGAISYDFVSDVHTGEVVSELDGRVLRGPKTCYEAGLIPIP